MHTFLVRSLPIEAAGIMGIYFMTQAGAMIDFDCCKLLLNNNGRRPRVHRILIQAIAHSRFSQ